MKQLKENIRKIIDCTRLSVNEKKTLITIILNEIDNTKYQERVNYLERHKDHCSMTVFWNKSHIESVMEDYYCIDTDRKLKGIQKNNDDSITIKQDIYKLIDFKQAKKEYKQNGLNLISDLILNYVNDQLEE